MVVPPGCAAEGACSGSPGARLHAGDSAAMFAVCTVVSEVVVMVFGAGEGSPFSALLGYPAWELDSDLGP